MSALQPSTCHADKLLCQIPLGLELHSVIPGQKKVYSSTTVVVEGFMEGLINVCLWEIKQGRICYSDCHWIWDRWGLFASNPHIWEREEACLEAGYESGGNREKENCFSQVKINLIHHEQGCLGHISACSPKR